MDIFGYNPIVSPIYVEPAFNRSNVVTTSQRQPRTVTGVVDSGDGFTIVQYSDGTTERRAGSRGIRNNNPGNLTGTLQGALRQGAVAVDHGGNYVFPDPQTGQRAMANFVLQRNADRSIGDMLGTYAPAGAANDPNNTNRLYPSMVQGAGFNLGDRVGALPAAEQQRLLDTMMGIETGQPAPARQVATLQTPRRGGLPLQERFANAGIQAPTFGGVMGALGNATVGPIMDSGSDLLGAVGNMGRAAGDFLSNPSMANLTRGTGETARRNAAALGVTAPQEVLPPLDGFGGGGGAGGISDRTGRIPGAVNRDAAASKARTLGLMSEPNAALAVADMTAGAVQEVAASDEPPKPLNERERKKFSPESLGLIAFGLSLLGGADIEDAMAMGMNTYNMVEDKRSAKAQRDAVDAFIQKQSPEDQELLRLFADSGNVDAIAQMQLLRQEQQAENEARTSLIAQSSQVTGIPADELALLSDDQIRSQVKESFKKDSGGVAVEEYLARYGAGDVPAGSREEVATKIATGNFTQSQTEAAGFAYVLAQVIPQMERLEELYFDPNVGWGPDIGVRNEYNRLKSEFSRAVLRKESGAAISVDEQRDVDRDYGFRNNALFGGKGVDRSNAVAAAARRGKLQDFANTGGLAYKKLMVESGINFSDDVLAGGVRYGADTNFIPTVWTPQSAQLPPNDLGIELEVQ
jgi:hypothetical protein